MAGTGKQGDLQHGGILSPLRLGLFRALWLANLVSATGTTVQGVGAAWLMITLASTPDRVALVQTATHAPILLFALLAGTLADLWDRRRVLLLAQLWTVLAAAGLALLSSLGLVTPSVLLLFTFGIGTGTALTGPAWQASVREIVPREELAAAVTLNAIAFNIARALGPAIGGIVVAAAGAAAAFYLNTLATLVLASVLLGWRRLVLADDLPRERLGSAIVTGLRYVAETRALRAVLTRGAVFGFAASASLALLPLLARDRLGGGPLIYGLLLGSFGVGALAGAFLVHPLRQRHGAALVVTVLSGTFGGAMLVLGLMPSRLVPVAMALALAGAAWLGSFSTFNIAFQMSTAFWVQARARPLPGHDLRQHGRRQLGLGSGRGRHQPRGGASCRRPPAAAQPRPSPAFPARRWRAARPAPAAASRARAGLPVRPRGRTGAGVDRVPGTAGERECLCPGDGRGGSCAQAGWCLALAPVPGHGGRGALVRGVHGGELARLPPPAAARHRGRRGYPRPCSAPFGSRVQAVGAPADRARAGDGDGTITLMGSSASGRALTPPPPSLALACHKAAYGCGVGEG
jgi:MFS family permease